MHYKVRQSNKRFFNIFRLFGVERLCLSWKERKSPGICHVRYYSKCGISQNNVTRCKRSDVAIYKCCLWLDSEKVWIEMCLRDLILA